MLKLKDGKVIREQMYVYLVGRYDGVTAPNWSLRKMLSTAYRFESEERTWNEMLRFIKPKKKMKILDAGCGFGHFVSYCLDKGHNCYGYEVDERLIQISKNILKVNKQNPNRIAFVNGKKLPYGNESFDLINLSFVLDYVQDIPSLLKELKRVLRKDGEIYIEAPNYLCCFSPIYALVFFPWLPKWLNRLYFRLRGRPNTKVIESLTFVTPSYLSRIFKRLNFKVENYGLRFWQDLIDQKNIANRNNNLLSLVNLANRLKLSWALKLFAQLGFYTPLIYILRNHQGKKNISTGKVYETDFIYNITEAISYKFFGKLFVWLPLTPNQITFFGFLLNGLPSAYFFSLGTHLGYLIGILFCISYATFDWMDGFVAKNKGLSSNSGSFLDPVFDFIWQHLLVTGLALGVYNSKGQSYLWLVLGFLTLVSMVVANHIGVIFRDKFDFKFRSTLTVFREEIMKNKKTYLFDLLGMQILAPTHFIFNFIFTIRYPLVVGAILNKMDIIMLFILMTQTTRATALFLTYTLYLDRDKAKTKRPIIRALEPREIKLSN